MRKPQNFQWKEMTMGTCYYPERWSRELWQDDLQRMKAAGITVIRVAEFAWNKVEPEEGVFTFDFWDDFLDLSEKLGMKVIFCTPTATPPAWLTEKYPEVLNADIQGNLYRHGTRRHYNYNSPKYRELCARITEKFASHYGPRKNIIGWQIDNELNCEKDVFYSESDTKAFRLFLKWQPVQCLFDPLIPEIPFMATLALIVDNVHAALFHPFMVETVYFQKSVLCSARLEYGRHIDRRIFFPCFL